MKRAEAIEGLRRVMRRQHKAWKTEQSYVRWLERYMEWLGRQALGHRSLETTMIYITPQAHRLPSPLELSE